MTDAPTAGPSGRSAALPAPDPALDFFSPHFDPLRALLAEGLLPPLPAARPLDTVHRCRFMLPPDHPDHWQDTKRAAKSKVSIAGVAQGGAMRLRQRPGQPAAGHVPRGQRTNRNLRAPFFLSLGSLPASLQEAQEAALREKSRLSYLQQQQERQQ